MPTCKPIVGIARLQLFRLSETFITAQAESCMRYEPLYIGQKLAGVPREGVNWVAAGDSRLAAIRLLGLRDPNLFLQALNGRAINVMHAHFSVDAAIYLQLARMLDVPLVTTIHGFDVTTNDQAFYLSTNPALWNAMLLRRRLQREGALFLCVSEHIKRVALAKGFPAEKTVVHPIGIDVERFSPAIEPSSNIILHVGRLVEKKGTTYLLSAFRKIVDRWGDAKLVIIGEGPLKAQLELQAHQLGLSSRVRFLGALPSDAVVGWLRKAAVVAAPSVVARNGDSEGLPTILFEASASGVPIVATYHSGIPEAVVDGTTGFLVPERDPNRLAERIGRLLANADIRRSFGAAGRRLVLSNFELHAQTRKLEAMYDAVREAHGSVSAMAVGQRVRRSNAV